MRRLAAILALLALVAAACTGGGTTEHRRKSPVVQLARGGTLRVAMPAWLGSDITIPNSPTALDPHLEASFDASELFRCCLLRTLLSYNGHPTDQGGTQLRPDLADGMPDVSPDGLTWTFHLQRGIRYAPPLQSVEITAQDFVRALDRDARLVSPATGGPPSYFSVIQGFDAYAQKEAGSISGLQAPDDHTLRVQLAQPAGDLGFRLALPAAAPIPPDPADPGAEFGAAEGHDAGYGRFLVASGPYTIEGSEHLDPSAPPGEQAPVSGFVPGKFLTLVRNPSWNRSTDDLRAAYADRIEVTIGGTPDQAASKLEQGKTDLVFYVGPPPQYSAGVVRRLRDNPDLGRVIVSPRDFVRALIMNVAEPPFDDIHVRKAANLVVDKKRMIELAGGAAAGRPAGHLGLDSLENDLLLNYDPYRTPGDAGSVRLARAEMAQSKYDANGDGRCDAPACRSVLALAGPLFPALLPPVRQAFEEIGIRLHVVVLDPPTLFARLANPALHVGMGLFIGVFKDYPNGAQFFPGLFSSEGIGANNFSLVGASPDDLSTWGYTATQVPTVDDRIDQCLPIRGDAQTSCWAALDKYLMEDVVPWVPYIGEAHVDLVSSRLASFSFDRASPSPRSTRLP
ncbi:MAG: ABC transporter substrate-binding protein [Actinomycetota bacterium]|nr:ABC transporter substrate-binding protein [Actinomycetota bacterium]